MEKKLESTDRSIPGTRYAFAEFLASVFQYHTDSDLGKRVVIEMTRCPVYGADHPDMLTTLNNAAYWTKRADEQDRSSDEADSAPH